MLNLRDERWDSLFTGTTKPPNPSSSPSPEPQDLNKTRDIMFPSHRQQHPTHKSGVVEEFVFDIKNAVASHLGPAASTAVKGEETREAKRKGGGVASNSQAAQAKILGLGEMIMVTGRMDVTYRREDERHDKFVTLPKEVRRTHTHAYTHKYFALLFLTAVTSFPPVTASPPPPPQSQLNETQSTEVS